MENYLNKKVSPEIIELRKKLIMGENPDYNLLYNTYKKYRKKREIEKFIELQKENNVRKENDT